MKLKIYFLYLLLFPILLSTKETSSVVPAVNTSDVNSTSSSKETSRPITFQMQVSQSMTQVEQQQARKKETVIDASYRQQYGMGYKETENMMNLGYEDFINKLFDKSNRVDELIWKLWNEYQGRYICKQKNVVKYTNIVQAKLKQRQQEKSSNENIAPPVWISQGQEKQRIEKQEKEHDRLQSIYNPTLLNQSDYVSPYQAQREQALQQTAANQYAKHERSYNLDAQTTGILIANGIDQHQFQSLSGTILQHQLFHEVANSYKKVAKVVFEYQLKNSFLVPHVIHFAEAAFSSNKAECIALSVQLSDIADWLAETSLSMCKGVIQSTCGLVDMAMHPRHTAQQLGKSLVSVLRILGGALTQYDVETTASVHHRESAAQVFQGDIQVFNQICEISKQAFQQCSTQEKVQVVSKVAADIILQPYLIGMAGKACMGLVSQAHELNIVESVVSGTEELRIAEYLDNVIDVVAEQELLITTVGEISPGLEESFVSLMEAEKSAVESVAVLEIVASERVFIENIQTLQATNALYKNNALQKKAIYWFDQYCCNKELLEFCGTIEKTHSVMKVQHLGEEVEMLCNPKHMFLYELDFKNIASIQKAEGMIGGGHVGLYYDELVRKGLFKIVSEEQLFGGCKAFEIEHLFGTRIAQKTVWPPNWNAQQIMDAIKEAWHNPLKQKQKPGSNVFCIKGKIHNGLEIEMYIEVLAQNKIKLKTAYPYFEGFSSI